MSLTSEASVTSTAEEVPAGPPSTVKVQPSRATAGLSGRLGAWPRLGLFHAFWRRDNRSDPQWQLTVWPTRCAGTPFVWSQTHNLILTDATGAPVLQSAAWPAVQLTVSMQVPLLHHVRCAARAYRAQMASPQCAPGNPRPHAPIPQGPGPVRQVPLLYWAERRQWMWHKKWTLPKLHVRVTCDGRLVGG